MTVLYATRGLPGSGKSTYAKAWVAENPTGRFRVNRDDLRAMGHNSTHIKPSNGRPGTEAAIVAARDAMVLALLRRGVDVIVDETCLPDRVVWALQDLARRGGASFEVVDFRHVPVETCIAWDAQRSGRARVGERVIRGMWEQHLADRQVAA